MAARSDDPDVSPESSSPAAAAGGEIWGTLEELLLACAVSRHGTSSWESVASEVQSRSPSAAARLTPTSCRLRFRLLHRRFAAGADEDGGGEPDPNAAVSDAWVDELRKLRVAELRARSLQSKVKRLKEERERSLSGETTPAFKDERETGNDSPEEAGGENGLSGEASARSCKESNSSDLKPPPGHDSGGAAADDDAEVKDEPAAGEMAAKDEASGESAAGSKEADAVKESSDVQSSASPSRKRRRRLRKVGGGDVASTSAPVPLPAAEAQPLLAFLESVRTSKSGAVFERRLESQESGKYKGTIRRHVDLEIIRSRLESGGASGGPDSACYASASEFYRDLLLLCANALVFFPRGSPEHAAATRTRALVSKRISATLQRDGLGTAGKAAPLVGGGSSTDGAKKTKADAEVAGSLLEKAAPIIVCRKRSSIAKAAAANKEKVEKEDTDEDEEFDEGKKKGSAKDKARGMRTNKGRAPVRNAAPNQKTGKASESAAADERTKKSDKMGGSGSGGKAAAAAGGVIKKRNAVDFLKRMKQNSVPSTERVSLLETLKLSATEQKKAAKADGRKEPGSSSGSKKAAETASGGRRSVGRPPKRAAAPPTPPPSKRAKDDRPTRKRGKK
ncbi:unnamed protein product [Triticum turgidum subsp. durum]|uniref:Bromo domain-containing protein n=1 Tax=Triticum turgidum subsp. durum TaxID=4567 RepID=A0A9R0Z9R5_TRITD|nr:unnamed protein product [Triticum turgidum subsp. durum]